MRVSSRVEFSVSIAIVALGSAAAWLRLPFLTQRTVWADDGVYFLGSAFLHRQVIDLFAGFGGYLQFIPRIMADAVVLLSPVSHVGVAMNLLSCIFVGAIAGLVFWCAKVVIPSFYLRIALASITFLAPLLPIEALGNAANLHWFLLWGTLWIMLYGPRTRTGAILLGGLLLLFALSEIQLALFLPLFFTQRKNLLSWIPRIGLAVGLIAQIATTILSPRPPDQRFGPDGSTVIETIKGFVSQAVMSFYTTDPYYVVRVFAVHALLGACVALVPFAIALVFVLWKGSPIQRVAVLYLNVGAVVLWCASIILNHYSLVLPATGYFGYLRYAVVPSMFLIASLVLAVQVLVSAPGNSPVILVRRTARVSAVVLAGALVFLMGAQFLPHATTRSSGPQWAETIVEAQQDCVGKPLGQSQTVEVAPGGAWHLRITCAELKD